MSVQNSLMILLGQLVMSSPILLVYVVGMVLAARYWRRAPRPAMFAMAGLALMLLATVGASASQTYFISVSGPRGMAAVATPMQLISLAFMVARAAGMGLVVAAVFASRPRGATGGFDMNPVSEPPLAGYATEPSARPHA
jgi:hypothetical protein